MSSKASRAQMDARVRALTPAKQQLYRLWTQPRHDWVVEGVRPRSVLEDDGPTPLERWCTLPNGLRVLCQNPAELTHFYDDIFVEHGYLRHGVRLPAAPVVFDVGANVGLFTLFVLLADPGARVLAFEPAAATFDHLRRNVAASNLTARLFRCALSNRRGMAPLAFYRNSSGMSSLYPDASDERHVLETVVRNQASRGDADIAALLLHAEDYFTERLRRVDVECPLDTVSNVMDAEKIERIDLLKIDAQKSELDILGGVEQRHWPCIRQVAAEVHDIGGRVECMKGLLHDRGYTVAVDQDDLYRGSNVFKLFATLEA